jgi:hypothetical protein
MWPSTAARPCARPWSRRASEFFPFERVDQERAFRNMRAIETPGRHGRRGRGLLRIFRDWLVETIPDQLADLDPVLDRWRRT